MSDFTKYSIKDLENLTGIKAHTIRMWEKRYELLNPHRTDTNIREYSDEDLKRLLNVSLLIEGGDKISRVSKYSTAEINKILRQQFIEDSPSESGQPLLAQINGLIVSMIEVDEEKFDYIFANAVARRGFENTVKDVIYPFLEKVGVLWTINELNPAQEHFVSNLIRQKIIVAIDQMNAPVHAKGTALLYLPEHELHEMGLLLANYLFRVNGFKTVYLGQNVPFDDVRKVAAICKPRIVFTFIVTAGGPFVPKNYIEELVNHFENKTVYVSGEAASKSNVQAPNLKTLRSIDEFVQDLQAFQ